MKSKVTKTIALIEEAKLTSSHQDSVLEFLRLPPYEVFSIKKEDKIDQDPGMNKSNAGRCIRTLKKKRNSQQ